MKVLKFTAPWCGPCQLMNEQLKNFTAFPIEEYNVDEAFDEVEKYNVSSVPTLVFEKDGEVVHTHKGTITPSKLEQLCKNLNQ